MPRYGKIAYKAWGCPSKPWIVFLHGFLGCKEDWEELATLLCADFYCLAFDLPGHGKTPFFPDFIPYFAHRISQFPREINLVGYSMGGRLAFQLRDMLKNIARIIFLSTSIEQSNIDEESVVQKLKTWPWPKFFRAWYAQDLFCTLNLSEERLKKRYQQNRDGLIDCFYAMRSNRLPKVAIDSATPQFFVYGEKDAKYAHMFKTWGIGIADASHAIHIESPHILNHLIRRVIMESTLSSEHVWCAVNQYTDIEYHKMEGIAKITINRPEVRNAFRPLTIQEISHALNDAREDITIGVIILTGKGDKAFCSGGDQRVRSEMGYNDEQGLARLNVLDLQRQIRTCPKPVVAMVAGYAIGGGHVLHVVCDLTIASDNAIFGQTGPKVGSFDGGFGASYLSRIVGQKKAREIWYLCRQYNAQQALAMGLVNAVVPYDQLETTTVAWCKEMLHHSPLALRCLKSALNADCDGQAGLQELAGNATLLFYMTEEAQEGKNAFLEKRKPDFAQFPKLP